MSPTDLDLIARVESLQSAYIATATSDGGDTSNYELTRRQLLANNRIAKLLPEFVRRYRTLDQFWPFIKGKFPTYAERRDYIWTAFRPALDFAEGLGRSPADGTVSEALTTLDAAHIHDLWVKALDRRGDDPEGAITAARALLESVCKLILDEAGDTYSDDGDLPKLYTRVAKRLNLAPSQHTEQVFRQVLGGCQAVVEGLGAVRNRLGDAHGKGKRPVKPAPRHAELVVNVAGAVSVFLASTWQARNSAV